MLPPGLMRICREPWGKGRSQKGMMALVRENFTHSKLNEFMADCTMATVVMEACVGTHFMARRIADTGHEAKLISAVRPPYC
ncbi:Transposase, fragment [Erwinia pyrifoliae Ep1/96]|nr:Transposase, fragment [Erwinia pyrifoliae Ep1/96]